MLLMRWLMVSDLLPDLHQGISEVLGSLWYNLMALDALIHNLPEVLGFMCNWTKI